ncbi:MAG: glucose 1-dehydrogenase [Pseudomonadota bacterium]
MLLSNRIAMVTGGAAGIGRAIVERLAKDGAKVVVVDVDDASGREVVGAVEALGGEAIYRSANISERLDIHNLVASSEDAFGRLDILVNNAAVIDSEEFLGLSEAEFDRVITTNLKGPFLLGQAVARRLVEQAKADGDARPAGSIVNITGVSAAYGLPHHVAYAASKGALTQLTKSMAVSLAPYGIRVNAVAPGSVETESSDSVLDTPEQRSAAMARTPLGRCGTPEEIAAVVAWLVSEEASYITGTTIWAEGGRLALNTVMTRGASDDPSDAKPID